MEKVLISKEWDQGYAFYAFKPRGYVDNFFERTSEMTGIGFDKRRGKWTAPARQESIDHLKRTFGNDCLIWRSRRSGHRSLTTQLCPCPAACGPQSRAQAPPR